MKYKVLLLTSGTGSRLGDMVTHTNKSLILVGEKPVICRIVDRYEDDIEIIVVLGHFGNQVKDFLEIAYPSRIFHFIYVDKYQGPGSSVLYSLLQAEKVVDCPFIIHACDTLVPLDNIPKPSVNWIGGQKVLSNDTYTSFDVSHNHVLKIYRKGKEHSDYACIGIAGVYDHKRFFEEANRLYQKNGTDSELSNIHVHASLVELGDTYTYVLFPSWLDTGNLNGLNRARKKYSTNIGNLTKKGESISRVEDNIVKFFFDKKLVKKRVERATILKGIVPDIRDQKGNFFSYKYVEGDVLSDVVTENLMSKLLDWSKVNLWKKMGFPLKEFSKVCYKFYFEKTRNRIQQFLDKYDLKDGVQNINGYSVPKVSDMLDKIPCNRLCQTHPYSFHGDFILDNIIFTGSTFVLIDWRQDFGDRLHEGDIYYDLAKLNCSLIFNQKIVSNKGFSVQQTSKGVTVDILSSYNLLQCKEVFVKFLRDNNFDIEKVNLISAIIWLNMALLHEPLLDRFLYYFGKLNLYKMLKRNISMG